MAKANRPVEQEEQVGEDLTIGNVNVADLAQLGFEEVDPLKGLDAAYNAGQEGFLAGTTKLGVYMGPKVCVSTKEKKPRWRAIEGRPGKVSRTLHIFQAATIKGEVLKTYFGIWHAGALTAMLTRVKRNQLVAVTYVGLGDKPFRAGDSLPHIFKLQGRGIEVTMSDLADIEPENEDLGDAPLTPEQVASLEATRSAYNGQGTNRVSA